MFDHQPAIGRIRNTLKETNKNSPSGDSRLRRVVRHLRERIAEPGRTVSTQMLKGASYSLGSGAVSLLILWMEARR
jgi:hypothetical protein